YRRMVEQEKQTQLLGERERVRLVLTAEGDPVSGTVFALGFRAERAGARPVVDVVLSRAGTHAAEGEMLRAFLDRLGQTATALLAAGDGVAEGKRGPKPLHAFVYDRAELDLLRGLLHRHMADAQAQPGIAALAGVLFPAAATAAGLRAAAAAPGTVVVDAVSELFALPVAYALDLPAVSAALQPLEGAHPWSPRADYGWPLSSQVAFERIHNVWRRRPHRPANEGPDEVRAAIEQAVRGKLHAIDSVIRGVREQALKTRTPRLRMDTGAAGRSVSTEPIGDAVLETLRIFTELEAAAESLAIRALHALPSRDRARRWEAITGLEPVERHSDREWTFEFDPDCREAKFRPGEFALVLTNDNGQMLAESDAKPWLRRKLMVELVRYDLAHERPRVTLGSDYGFARLEREGVLHFDRQCVLDRAEADFNTRRVVATLRRLAEGHGEARFVRGLLDGSVDPGWLLAPLDRDEGWRGTIATVPRPVLNAKQSDAWRATFERAVTVIWGPPGTGKTYLLAWTLLGLAAAARAAGRPLRILVSAATHRAIANVLVRIARELSASGIDSPLRLVKLASRGTEADQELEGAGVELVKDERLEGVLTESDETGLPVVVGSTVWSLWKQMKAAGDEEGEASDAPIAPMFDVVVIDEASQMKVADSLIALSSIRRGGRVLLCGDDRQLAPIVRGTYDGDNTLFGSAFAHFAEKFGRMTLRESRRMNGPLVAYPRQAFYPGLVSVDPGRRLSIAPPSDQGDAMDALIRDAFLRPEDSVVFCTYTGYTATARNPFEARLAARIATLARAELRDPATGEAYPADGFREQGLAILSPHRAQNSAILHELVRAGWSYGELPIVDTVERMQGNEREMIIVSYAVADHEYAEREAEFLLDPNRFNVAITRPRAKLVLLVSDHVLRALPRDERVMTGSMALKGYLRQAWRRIRELELPAPDGGTIPVTLRVR
ncbi:MAG TPA: ATP-binding protein, partial [Longimicrobium sp.]|nr:ATP-binding protein [Longimicrobium sp.]